MIFVDAGLIPLVLLLSRQESWRGESEGLADKNKVDKKKFKISV